MSDPRIFFSFSRDELPFVRSVAAALQEHGVETWLDPHDIQSGEAFSERLSASLRGSSALVVFISHAVESPWMNFEIGAALAQSKTVLPVFLSHPAREQTPPFLAAFSSIDASDLKPDQVAERIAEALQAASA